MSIEAPADGTIIPLLDPEHDPGDTNNGPYSGNATHATSGNAGDKMKAVHYEGPFKVAVKEVELPKIQHPDDVIIKVTTAGTILDFREWQAW
jgi:hypothetical protein